MTTIEINSSRALKEFIFMKLAILFYYSVQCLCKIFEHGSQVTEESFHHS